MQTSLSCEALTIEKKKVSTLHKDCIGGTGAIFRITASFFFEYHPKHPRTKNVFQSVMHSSRHESQQQAMEKVKIRFSFEKSGICFSRQKWLHTKSAFSASATIQITSPTFLFVLPYLIRVRIEVRRIFLFCFFL